MEFFNKNDVLNIVSSSKATVFFDTCSNEVKLNDLSVSFPGEYEAGGILLEVKEYNGILFYSFIIEGKNILIIPSNKFELKEDILSFFGNVDVLVIIGEKESAPIFENIEARITIPYGAGKQSFLVALGQNIEEIQNYKIKGDLPENNTEFVNLA